MADYNALLSFVDKGQSEPTNAAAANSPAPVDLAPLSKQALADTATLNAPNATVSLQGNLNWFDRNQRQDEQGRTIPIDTKSGIELGDFARMVWQRRPEERVQVLSKIFPGSLVREADTGDLIVEVRKPGEPVKDVLVNPLGFNPEDFIQTAEQTAGPTLLGTAGMIGGEAIGAKIAGKPGAAVGKVLGAAIGSGVGGAITDVAARGVEGLPLNLTEVAKEQSKSAAANALFDVGLYGGAKLLRGASPFATTRGPLQFNLANAKRYFRDNYGVDFKTTPAEESGSQLLARLERTESQLPGAGGVFGTIYQDTQKRLQDIFDAATGGRLSNDQLGQSIVPTVKSALVQPAEDAVQSARKALLDKGEQEIVDVIDSLAPGSATKQAAGEATRAEFQAARDTAKRATDAAYDAVRRIPGGTGKTLPADPIVSAAKTIRDELPTSLTAVEKKAYDAYGNPISRPAIKKEILASGRPEGLMTFLNDMSKLKGQKMSLDELTKLKNSARDEIAKTEAVPGVKDRWFGMVENAYKDAIDSGIAGLSATPKSSGLATALANARDTYKTRLLPFDREGLHDILRTPYETGFKSPEQLISRLFSGERADYNYRVLKETLGSGSAAFQKIKRAVVEQWRDSAVDPITKRVNPADFEAKALALRESHPEIYKDVIGPAEQKLFEATSALRVARKEIGDVDPEQLAKLLRSGNPTRPQIEALALAQKNRDTVLSNEYLRSLASGKPVSTTPAEFVSSLFNAQTDNRYLADVLATLSPSQTEDLQRAALYRILQKASDSRVDMARYLDNAPSPFQANAAAKVLGPVGSEELAKNEMLLGPNYRELVRNAMALLAPREEKTGLFKAAGSMAATGILQKLLDLPLQYASKWVKKSIAATIYTSEPIKKLLINAKFGPAETAAYANALIASEPFIKAAKDAFGHDAAFSIALDAKHSIDKFLRQNTQPSQGQAQHDELMRFLQTGKGKVKLNPK